MNHRIRISFSIMASALEASLHSDNHVERTIRIIQDQLGHVMDVLSQPDVADLTDGTTSLEDKEIIPETLR